MRAINISLGTLLFEYLTIKYITEIRNHAWKPVSYYRYIC